MPGQGSHLSVGRQAIFRLRRLKPAATNLFFLSKRSFFQHEENSKFSSEKSFDHLDSVSGKKHALKGSLKGVFL